MANYMELVYYLKSIYYKTKDIMKLKACQLRWKQSGRQVVMSKQAWEMQSANRGRRRSDTGRGEMNLKNSTGLTRMDG